MADLDSGLWCHTIYVTVTGMITSNIAIMLYNTRTTMTLADVQAALEAIPEGGELW